MAFYAFLQKQVWSLFEKFNNQVVVFNCIEATNFG